jgi:hypothetical protein
VFGKRCEFLEARLDPTHSTSDLTSHAAAAKPHTLARSRAAW